MSYRTQLGLENTTGREVLFQAAALLRLKQVRCLFPTVFDKQELLLLFLLLLHAPVSRLKADAVRLSPVCNTGLSTRSDSALEELIRQQRPEEKRGGRVSLTMVVCIRCSTNLCTRARMSFWLVPSI